MNVQSRKTNFKINIPFPVKEERYKDACLSKIDFLTDLQAESLNNWIANPKHFLFCQSDYGVGKSYLAAAVAIDFYKKNIPVWMFNEYDLFTILESEEKEGRQASWKIKDICENPIIVWNDFGSMLRHGKNDFRENEKINLMFQFIDDRYNSKLPTIITTNFKIQELCDIINPRISSRLQATENLILEIYGPDKRQEGL